jgi:transcriptional regulator
MFVRGNSLVGHLARPNQIWRQPGPALAIFSGPQAYISPRWYENKRVDGKVVPTWNYTTVQVHGRLVAHDDPNWIHQLVSELTDRFEAPSPAPWAVTDAPDDFIRTMLRGIVGVELVDLQIVGKAKLSQNRSEIDQQQVAAGLLAGSPGEQAVGRTMSGSASD